MGELQEFFDAINRVADSLEKLVELADVEVPKKTECTCKTKTEEPAGAVVLDYEGMEHADLKKLCEARGIEVPLRTKKPTLIKWLKTKDLVTTACGEEPDPEPEPEPDPFAGGENKSSNEEITREMVTDKLREILVKQREGMSKEESMKKGQVEVLAFVKSHAGVEMIKDIPEENLADVYRAAKEAV